MTHFLYVSDRNRDEIKFIKYLKGKNAAVVVVDAGRHAKVSNVGISKAKISTGNLSRLRHQTDTFKCETWIMKTINSRLHH